MTSDARLGGCDAADSVIAYVQEQGGYVCRAKGGYGAVREVVEWLLR